MVRNVRPRKPGPKLLAGFPCDLFARTTAMAGSQGLCSGILAAGPIWLLPIGGARCWGTAALFFMVCLSIAGVYDAATATRKTLYIRTVPAFATMLALSVPSAFRRGGIPARCR